MNEAEVVFRLTDDEYWMIENCLRLALETLETGKREWQEHAEGNDLVIGMVADAQDGINKLHALLNKTAQQYENTEMTP